MTTDYKSKEKAFLESLKADSGRDLGEWMAAIGAQNLTQRNDIIDWLRHQGFIFAWASWLERIYHNGGRPIYLSELPPSQPALPQASRPALRLVASNPDGPVKGSQPSPPRKDVIKPVKPDKLIKPVPVLKPSREPEAGRGAEDSHKSEMSIQSVPLDTSVNDTIAKAKAFAPLARHFMSELNGLVTDISVIAKRQVLEFHAPLVFGALVMSPRGLRLFLDLGDLAFTSTIIKARAPSPFIKLPTNLTHMVLLDDARQIDPALKAVIKSAHDLVNG